MTDRATRIMDELDRDIKDYPRPDPRIQKVPHPVPEEAPRQRTVSQDVAKLMFRSVTAGNLLLNDLINQKETIVQLYDSHIQRTKGFLAETERFLQAVQGAMKGDGR